MTHPSVTVLIDTYNHERFLEDAIVSVLEQDFPAAETEIVVVDDGSTDRTPEIARKFAPRVRYLRKENGGQASAFNFGIPQTRGEIISFLDGDDWWKKNKLTRAMEAFEKNPTVGVVGHGIVQIENATGKNSALSPEFPGYFNLQNSEGARTFRNYMCFLGTSRVAIRRNVLEKILPIPETLFIEADEFMSALAVAHSAAFLLPDSLTFYRLHEENYYQFRGKDDGKLRRKKVVLDYLAKSLQERLAEAGVSSEAIGIIVDPVRLEASRMRLQLDGGTPWETYKVEKASVKLSYKSAKSVYKVYKELSLLLALAMPPRRFYQLREWYAANNLRRYRSWLGEPVPAQAIKEQALPAHPEASRKV